MFDECLTKTKYVWKTKRNNRKYCVFIILRDILPESEALLG